MRQAKQSFLQWIFKMYSVSCNAEWQSIALFHDYTVDHLVIKTVSLLLDALVQLFHILDLLPVIVVLQNPPPHVINWI